jgi:hypothetical protein
MENSVFPRIAFALLQRKWSYGFVGQTPEQSPIHDLHGAQSSRSSVEMTLILLPQWFSGLSFSESPTFS